MPLESNVFLVMVTAPSVEIARVLARGILEAKLAACVNLLPQLESHYWWKDQIESASETLLLIKTTDRHLPALEDLVKQLHPYETPEFIYLPITGGSAAYLAWIQQSVLR